MVFIYKKFNYLNQRQVYSPEHDPIPENTQEPVPEIDLDSFDIENFDSLAPWEQNAHIWINEQVLSIKMKILNSKDKDYDYDMFDWEK